MNKYSYKIRYISESISLLRIITEPAPYFINNLDRNAKKYNIIPGNYQKELANELSLIESEAREEFSDDMNNVNYYFVGKEDYVFSFANILLLYDNGYPIAENIPNDVSIKEYQKRLNELPEKSYSKYFYQLTKSIGSNSIEGEDEITPTMPEIFDAIFEANIDDAEKLKLQHFYIHRKEHIEKVFLLLNRANGILKRHEKKLEEFGKQVIAYSKKAIGDEPFVSFIMQKMYSSQSDADYPKDCMIRISYMQSLRISVNIKGESMDSSNANAQIGAIFSDSLPFEQVMTPSPIINQENALSLLKLLSDKSKLEILELTKDEALYGAQLADKLGLTTATISHHTQALLNQKFLNIDKVDSKIYYKQNKETVKSLIKYLEASLIN